jgi:hypothetical protein
LWWITDLEQRAVGLGLGLRQVADEREIVDQGLVDPIARWSLHESWFGVQLIADATVGCRFAVGSRMALRAV